MRRSLTALWSVVLVVSLSPVRGDEQQGRLIVKVMVEGTGEPLPGATVHANLGILEPNEALEKRITDSAGKYALAVPWGSVRLSTPMPPVGYWMAQKMFGRLQTQEQFVVTRHEPTIERSFTAQKGIVWPVKVITASGRPLTGARPHATRWLGRLNEMSRGGIGVTDAMGEGQLTLPLDGGDVQVHCGFEPILTALARRVSLQITPGFDHKNVVRQERAPGGDRIDVFDDQGRKVSCEGCRVVVRERAGQLVLEVPEPAGPSMAGEVVGRVVDHAGNGVKGATVMYQGYGVTAEEYQKQTDEEGAFRFRGLLKWSPPGQLPGFSIVATKEGCASAQATHIYVAGEDGTMHLKDPIVLRPGYSVRLQVLSEDGQPVEGAWVQSNAREFQIVKSGVDGNCVLKNLPEGTTAVGVSYGSDGASSNVVASPSTPSAPAVVVRLKKRSAEPTATASKPKVKRVAVGEAAPEWSISQWTDAKEHSLAALRGKVVVIEFWDFGCGPCKAITMPVSNAMQPKYAKDVAFVHIHPAGEELSLVREWLAAQPWDMLVGFDKGTGSTDSETLKRYGVDGFPAIIIVDRQGRVFENDESTGNEAEEMAKRKVLAEEAGLPWPIEKDASEGEKIRRLRVFHEHWMTKKIQAALAKE